MGELSRRSATGSTVLTIPSAPGVVNTPMNPVEAHEFLRQLSPLKRLAEVGEVAGLLLYLESAQFVNGEVVHLDGGAHVGKVITNEDTVLRCGRTIEYRIFLGLSWEERRAYRFHADAGTAVSARGRARLRPRCAVEGGIGHAGSADAARPLRRHQTVLRTDCQSRLPAPPDSSSARRSGHRYCGHGGAGRGVPRRRCQHLADLARHYAWPVPGAAGRHAGTGRALLFAVPGREPAAPARLPPPPTSVAAPTSP